MPKVGSIYPYTVEEYKPGLHPSTFIIEGTKDSKFPTIFEVKDAHYYIQTDNNISQKIPVLANDLAKSIVNDFISGCMGTATDANPGIFIYNSEEDLPKAITSQNKWFKRLIEMADNDWSITHRPGGINRIQRYAAKVLGVEREWTTEASDNPKFCPACTRPVSSGAVVCMNCQCILDAREYAKLQFVGQSDKPEPLGAEG